MSTNANINSVGRLHSSIASTRNDRCGDIFRQNGDASTAATHQKRPAVNTNKGTGNHRHTGSASNGGDPNVITSILLDELDDEIIHAEETDLMFKYYNLLQDKVRWETRGQHCDTFNAIINSRNNKNEKSSTARTQTVGSKKGRKPQSPPQQQLKKKKHKMSKSSIITRSALDTESMLILPKSLRRQCNTSTINMNPNDSQSRQRRRPRLRLLDNRITTDYTRTNSVVLRDSVEIIHDSQLVRATILFPRLYVTNSANSSSNRKEWNKKELERYLYTKFLRSCLGQRRIYCTFYHHPCSNDEEDHDDNDMCQNVYWKHFRIYLQSANLNSWRCIVIGYRTMVEDVLRFLQQLKLFPPQRNTGSIDCNNNK